MKKKLGPRYKYGMPTTPIRVPTCLLADFKKWLVAKLDEKK